MADFSWRANRVKFCYHRAYNFFKFKFGRWGCSLVAPPPLWALTCHNCYFKKRLNSVFRSTASSLRIQFCRCFYFPIQQVKAKKWTGGNSRPAMVAYFCNPATRRPNVEGDSRLGVLVFSAPLWEGVSTKLNINVGAMGRSGWLKGGEMGQKGEAHQPEVSVIRCSGIGYVSSSLVAAWPTKQTDIVFLKLLFKSKYDHLM